MIIEIRVFLFQGQQLSIISIDNEAQKETCVKMAGSKND